MTTPTAVAGAELVPVTEPPFSEGERAALAGFLAGYSGLTHDAYTLDLRMYTAWCVRHGLHLFTVRWADIECFGRAMEAAGRARATFLAWLRWRCSPSLRARVRSRRLWARRAVARWRAG
jgi:hypothetical protein